MHPVAVIPDIVPFGVGCDSVIHARNESAKVDQGLEAFDFDVDRGKVESEYFFIHSPNAAYGLPELLPPRRNVGLPCPNLDGEHRVDAVLDPNRYEIVDLAIAIKGDNVDAGSTDQFGNASIVGADLGTEHLGVDERTALEANVLPEVGKVERGRSGLEYGPGDFETKFPHRVNDFIEERFVVHLQVGSAHQSKPVANHAVQAAAKQAEGSVPLILPNILESAVAERHVSGIRAHGGLEHAFRNEFEPGFIDFFPRFPVLEHVIDFRGNRPGVRHLQDNGAIAGLNMPGAVGEFLDDFALDGGS